jgi:hypothetical protein
MLWRASILWSLWQFRRSNLRSGSLGSTQTEAVNRNDILQPPNSVARSIALLGLYDRLTCGDPIQPVDLIFVIAGLIERKPYGLSLFRAGVAPVLIVSVARFGVSKLKHLQFPGAEELVLLRDRTPADERHFFMEIDDSGVRIQKMKLPRWNTYGEVFAFREYIKDRNPARVMVISTDIHLRRVALTFRKVFGHTSTQFLFCPVPPTLSSLQKHRWWTRASDRQYVFKETLKLGGYRVILSMPGWAVRRLFRLKFWLMVSDLTLDGLSQ